MSSSIITDLGRLDTACQRTEQLVQEAAEAERAAFAKWQHAYGAYEVACEDAATVRANWEHALIS